MMTAKVFKLVSLIPALLLVAFVKLSAIIAVQMVMLGEIVLKIQLPMYPCVELKESLTVTFARKLTQFPSYFSLA